MKAKTLMGMIACAGACVSLSAFGNTNLAWFDGNVSTTTASAISTPTSAAWTGTDGVTPAAGVIQIDNDSASPLVLTPTSGTEPTLSDGVVTVAATAVLTPTDASALETITDAKAGFAAGIWDDNGTTKTNYYGYAAGISGDTKWVKLVGAMPPSGDTTATEFKLVLDYRTGKKNVKFFVGDTLLASDTDVNAFSIGDASALVNIAAYGSGSISVLAATCEKKVAVYGDIGYGSIAEAVIDAGASKDSVKVVDANGQASSGEAANGLQKWECAALGIAEDKQVGLAKSTKQNAGKITLAVHGVTVGEDLSVKYGISKDGADATGEFDADNIQIPMGDGQHTYKIVPTITAAQ